MLTLAHFDARSSPSDQTNSSRHRHPRAPWVLPSAKRFAWKQQTPNTPADHRVIISVERKSLLGGHLVQQALYLLTAWLRRNRRLPRAFARDLSLGASGVTQEWSL